AGEPRLASFKHGHIAGIARATSPTPPRKAGPVTVSLRDVTFRYAGAGTPALSGLSLEIPAGALVGVTGPVGSGKSALARSILGIHPIESGAGLGGGGEGAQAATDATR